MGISSVLQLHRMGKPPGRLRDSKDGQQKMQMSPDRKEPAPQLPAKQDDRARNSPNPLSYEPRQKRRSLRESIQRPLAIYFLIGFIALIVDRLADWYSHEKSTSIFASKRLTPFQVSNLVEAGFWSTIGLAFAVVAIRRTGAIRWRCAVTCLAFLFFGVSDLVEAQTGTWWRPWWLFVWKVACLAILMVAFLIYRRDKKRSPTTPP